MILTTTRMFAKNPEVRFLVKVSKTRALFGISFQQDYRILESISGFPRFMEATLNPVFPESRIP